MAGCEQLATKTDIAAINNRLTSIEAKINNLPDKNYIKNLIDSLANLIRSLSDFLDSKFSKVIEAIKALESIINNAIDSLENTIITAINGLVEIIKLFFGKGGQEIDYGRIEGFHTVTRDVIVSTINGRFNEVKTSLSQILEAIKNIKCNIDYGKIEGFHAKTREIILDGINQKFDKITALLNKIIGLIKEIECDINYDKIEAFHKQTRSYIQGYIKEIANRIEETLQRILEALNNLDKLAKLLAALLTLFQTLYNLFQKKEEIDYDKIEGFHVKTRQVVLGYTSGVLTSYFGQQQRKLNHIISLFDKIKPQIDYTLIEAFHYRTRDVIVGKLVRYIYEEIYSKLLLSLTSILNAINKLKLEIDYEIIRRFHQQTRRDIIDYIRSLLPFVDYDKFKLEIDYSKIESFHKVTRYEISRFLEGRLNIIIDLLTQIRKALDEFKCEIDYEKIRSFHDETRKNIRDYVAFDLNNRMTLINSLFNNTFTRLNLIVQYLLSILSKLSGESTIKIASCKEQIVDENNNPALEGTTVDALEITPVTTTNFLQGLSLLSDQIANVQLEACKEKKEVIVGVVSSEKEIIHITGNKLVMHLVTLDNYPKRKHVSSPKVIQVPVPKEDFEGWDVFRNLRWQAGLQYAEMKLESWKTPISGWFASDDDANNYFDYLLQNILQPDVVEINRAYPKHTSIKVSIVNQTWRPHRAYLMSPANDGQAKCLKAWSPPANESQFL